MLLLFKPGNAKSLKNTATRIFYVTLRPPMQKSCIFPLPKHPKNKRELQCISKQDMIHVRTIA